VSGEPQARRGDIWRVAFGRPVGHEQGAGTRPALVISSDAFNVEGGIVIAAPITSTARAYPSRVRIRPGASGLERTSWAAVEHLRSISTLRLSEYVGAVDPGVLTEVERVVDLLLFDRD
jgi:mRNA interferase MazF